MALLSLKYDTVVMKVGVGRRSSVRGSFGEVPAFLPPWHITQGTATLWRFKKGGRED